MFLFSEFKRGFGFLIATVVVDVSASRCVVFEAIARVIRDTSLFAINVTTLALLTGWVLENVISMPYLLALFIFALVNLVNVVFIIPSLKKKKGSVVATRMPASGSIHKRVVMVLATFLSSLFYLCLVSVVSYFVGFLCVAFFVFVTMVFYVKLLRRKMLTRLLQNSLLLVFSLLLCASVIIHQIGLDHSLVAQSANEVIFVMVLIILTRRCGQASWSFGKQLYLLSHLIKRKEFEAVAYLATIDNKVV